MCRIILALVLLSGQVLAGGYDAIGSTSDYSPFPAADGYNPFGSGVDTSRPPATRNEDRKTDNVFGRDRAVIIMAEWCIHCPKEQVAKAVAAMVKNGWKIGPEASNAIQLLDVDKDTVEADRVLNALDQHTAGLPFMVAVEGGQIVRRLETGCTTPIDQWSLGWLATGKDERPGREKEPATVKRSGNYPLRGGWWTVNQYRSPPKSYIVSHLLSGGAHAGKFARDWLNSLSVSELHSLHSDDHEGHIRWGYVNKYASGSPSREIAAVEKPAPPERDTQYTALEQSIDRLAKELERIKGEIRPATTKPQPAKIVTTAPARPASAVRYASSCPTGRCPYSSQRTFRR